jgi:dinuclear metal center YbgI/SA1388 family protein
VPAHVDALTAVRVAIRRIGGAIGELRVGRVLAPVVARRGVRARRGVAARVFEGLAVVEPEDVATPQSRRPDDARCRKSHEDRVPPAAHPADSASNARAQGARKFRSSPDEPPENLYLSAAMTHAPARLSALVDAMERIAPSRLAASWDNVGLLVGDPKAPLSSVLLTIDLTGPVLDEALRLGASAVVSYHPPLFQAMKRFVAGAIAFEAARSGLGVYSPHTALDAAEGGTNDVLADLLGMTDRRPLQRLEPADAGYKLVTFVPEDAVERVSRAVFEAGAGHIGRYSACSFRAPGTGTFFGEEGANPVVGQAGRLETAPEVRVETVVPAGRAGDVVQALRAAHPYEEPAFDLVKLASVEAGRGFGRVGAVERVRVREVVDRVKRGLGVDHVLVAGALDLEVTRAAVCAGSGGDLVGEAIAAGANVFLAGEVRHHDALRASRAGMSIVCVRHSVSERVALGVLEKRLAQALPGVRFIRSVEDKDPFVFA